jgi:transcriptional regulator with XRE-family HTH domain
MRAPNQLMIDRLKKEMKRIGINARELSDRASVGRSFVYDILNGKSSNPTTQKIAAVAEILGVSVPYLITGSSNDNDIIEHYHESHIGIPEIDLLTRKTGHLVPDILTDRPLHFFQKEFLKMNGLNDHAALRVFRIKGETMAPTLKDGDMVLLNCGQIYPSPPGIFLIHDASGIVPKRIEAIPQVGGGHVNFQVSSDNTQYASYSRTASDVSILGRVVWFSRRLP